MARGARSWVLAAALMLGAAQGATQAAAAAPSPGSLRPVSSSPCLSEPGNLECAHHAYGLSDSVGAVAGPDGRFVYVAGYGSNAIAELQRANDGSLTPIAGHGCIVDAALLGESCPDQSNGLGGVTALAISADGKYLYAVSQASGGGAVAWFARGADGSLSALGCLTETGGTSCAAGGNANTAKGLAGAVGIALSPDGANVYVAGAVGNDVAEFQRHPDGSLTSLVNNDCIGFGTVECPKSSPGLALSSTIAISADGRNVYVAGQDDVAELVRHSNGALSAISGHPCIENKGGTDCGASNTSPGLQSVASVAISPDQQTVYAGGGQAVASLVRRSDGSLRPLRLFPCFEEAGGSACGAGNSGIGLDGIDSLVASPDGGDVYASANDAIGNPGSVAILQRNPGNGAVFEAPSVACVMEPSSNQGCPGKVLGLTAPGGLAIAPDGRNVYLAAGSLAELARPLVPPVLTHNSIAPSRFVRGTHPLVRWLLSGPATIKFVVESLTPGRLVHHACVAPNHHNRKKPQCTRVLTRGSFSRPEPAGPGNLSFTGALIGRALSPGPYRLVLTPSAGRLRGNSVTLSFRVLAG